VLRQVVPPIFFLSAGLLWLLILAGLYTLLKRHNKGFPLSFAPFTLQVSLASGFILSPTLFNAPYRQDQECGQDMFAYYRELGTDLANLIPSGSRVYWQVQSAAPLLYLPPVEIWPTQVYNVYSYRLGGDPQQVEASGYWNADLAREWAKEADFLVLEGEQSYTPVTAEFATVNGYEQIGVLRPINPCAYLHTPVLVFRKTR
ncbi:MAG: hypothetical protein RMJ60_01855, partial [Anaerolineales bacterium]|nr:hypothetical protein [Anaerolineales bacterium]